MNTSTSGSHIRPILGAVDRRTSFMPPYQYDYSSNSPPTLHNIRAMCCAINEARVLSGSMAEFAHVLGISLTALYSIYEAHEDLRDAIKSKREQCDAKVENALYSKAIGYEHAEDKVFYDSKRAQAVVIPTVKRYAPDTEAAMHWLSNRQPGTWQRKVDTKVDTAIQINIVGYTPGGDR